MIHGTRAWAAWSRGSLRYSAYRWRYCSSVVALEVLAGGARPLVGVAARGVLVDVVTEEHERVDGVLVDDVAVGGVSPVLPVLARREGEAEPIGGGAERGHRPGAGRLGGEPVEAESVPVPGVGVETVDVGVHTVAERGDRRCLAGPHDVVHRRVGGHVPDDGDVAGGELVGHQHGPQRHTIVERIARRDTEAEGVDADRRFGRGRSRRRRVGGLR